MSMGWYNLAIEFRPKFGEATSTMTDNLTDVERVALAATGQLPRLLFVIAGPSGVGKNTIIKEVLTNHPREMTRLITYTTRPPREDEVEGEQYHFVAPDQFSDLALQGRLMEADENTIGRDVYDLGYVYSMPTDIFDGIPASKHLMMAEVDIYGMRLLREHYPDCITIFVTTSPDTLLERILDRPDEHMNENNLAHRMETARQQIAAASDFDYIVFNDEGRLYHAVRAVEAIIRSERMRVRRNIDLLASLPTEFFSPQKQS